MNSEQVRNVLVSEYVALDRGALLYAIFMA
jgi:hypothetical protein